MEELKYKHYTPASMEGDYAFSSSNAYTGPTSELDTRQQLSFPLWEIKKFVNDTCSTSTSSDPDDFAVKIKIGAGYLGYRSASSGTYTQVVPSYVGMVLCCNLSSSSDVANAYGGTWDLVDKDFTNEYIEVESGSEGDYFTANSTNVSAVSDMKIIRKGKQIKIVMKLKAGRQLTDSSEYTFGNINLSNLGLETCRETYYSTVSANGGYMSLHMLAEDDVVKLKSTRRSGTISSGTVFVVEFCPDIYLIGDMKNSVCDKFYWRRTA